MKLKIDRRTALLAGGSAFLWPALARAATDGVVRAPIIRTASGAVQGTVVDGVPAYLGMPYGAPPVGPLRFMPPVRPASWKGVRDCTRWPAIAVQQQDSDFEGMGKTGTSAVPPLTHMPRSKADIMRLPQSEDCLSLDVWTPSTRPGAKKPVMVWFHGGGYDRGSGSGSIYAGANLVKAGDVVLVNVNHRLNVFGYLHLGDIGGPQFASSGNVGIQDLVLALRWVQANIAQFGGDPRNVTIFGQSGGGAKVSALLAMPSAKGLFHKAIVMSGSVLRVQEKPRATQVAKALMAELGLAENDIKGLQAVDARKLHSASVAALGKLGGGFGRGPSLSPVLDGMVIPRHPYDPDAPAISADIPMLVGTVKDEAASAFRTAASIPVATDEQLMKAARAAAGDRAQEAIDIYRKLRPDDANIYRIVDIQTQSGARKNACLMAERKIAQGRAKVWMYINAWEGPPNRKPHRAHHSIDLGATFANSRAEIYFPYSPEAAAFDKVVPAAWTAFAHKGDPNNPLMPHWPAYNLKDRPVMLLDVNSKLVNGYEDEARAFWASVPTPGWG